MILLRLYFEFFMVGLFSVGGGLATIPFLKDMAVRTGWFTMDQLTNMIAVSESTPGPMGVNMATYVGFEVSGIPGAVVATLGLITPCIIVILVIQSFLVRFRDNRYVDAVFYGLRPASAGLIAAAGWSVAAMSLFKISWPKIEFQWLSLVLAAIILLFTNLKWTKKVHPIVWIGLAAVAGVLLEL